LNEKLESLKFDKNITSENFEKTTTELKVRINKLCDSMKETFTK
jgi:hypothetical protein